MARPRKNPPKALSAVANSVSTVVNKYDAAGTGKRMAGWNPPSSGPNRAVVGLQKIRDRARDSTRNDWSGESAVQKWTTNLIGIGITPRLRRVTDAKRKVELTDLWDEFVANCDADGVLNFYGLQTMAVRAWLEAGEVFIRKRVRRPASGLLVPLQVQLVEAEFVPLLDANFYPGLPVGNTIRSGIERDNRGQRTAYWMFKEHPGDGYNGNFDASKLIRILASDVKHLYMPARPGALRGVSMLAAILPKLRDIGNYQDAVLLRQQIANLFVAFITKNAAGDAEGLDALTGKALEGTFDEPLAPMSPGILQELDDGQSVTFANPPEAGTMYSEYIRTEHMGTAAGTGLPYEIFSGDIRAVSDRTLRVVIQEFRRFAEQRQWQVIIPMLCQPVREWFTQAAAFAGLIAQSEIEDVTRVEWSPHGWQYIHPVQDVQGKKIAVDAGFASRSSVISERGDDPEKVDQERADDMAREKDLDLWVDPNAAPGEQVDEVDEDDIPAGEYPAQQAPSALETALQKRAEAETELLTARTSALQSPLPTAPAEEMSLFDHERLALTGRIVDLLGPAGEQ